MNPTAPVPADPELALLRARLRSGLARMTMNGKTCRPGSRIHRLKTRMVNIEDVKAAIEEALEEEGAQPTPKNGTAPEAKSAPVRAVQTSDRPQVPPGS